MNSQQVYDYTNIVVRPYEAQLVDLQMRFFRGLAIDQGEAGKFLFFDRDEFEETLDRTLQLVTQVLVTSVL
jgi:hypothetical protein